jgi:maltoporin
VSRRLVSSAVSVSLGLAAASTAWAQEAPVATPVVGDVAMHGYFRMGYGASSEKGRMVCFQAPGALAKYRLGNECDQYGEFNFSAPMYVGGDGSVATAYFMPAVYIPSTNIGYAQGVSSPPGTTATGADWGFPIFYMDLKGVPWLSGGTVWTGRRYYKREDFHLMDFFYWNPSGLGGGIEDIDLGGMKLSYAAFVVEGPGVSAGAGAPPLPPREFFGVRNDFQLRAIPLYPGGELEIGLNLVVDYSDNDDTHSGWGATVRHVQEMLGGTNKLAIQYGQGGGTGFGIPDSLVLESGVSRLRIVDVLTIQPTAEFGGQLGVIYQRDDLDPGTQTWLSVGARGSYALSEHFKLILEAGHDNVKPEGGDARSLTKITFAPAISATQGFMTRPEFRLFYTFAAFNDAAREANVDSGGIYTATTKTSGSSFGIQAETWW